MNQFLKNSVGTAAGVTAGAFGRNPFRSVPFLAALALIAWGTVRWYMGHAEPRPPLPWYVPVAGSFAGGFLIGRIFRTAVKTAALVAFLVMGILGVLKFAKVDTSRIKQHVETGTHWVEKEATDIKDYLLRFLPSGGAAGTGVFFGAGRKRKV